MKKIKKVMSFLLVLIVLLIEICYPTLAQGYSYISGDSTKDVQQGINDALKSLNNSSIKTTQTTEAALYNIKNILRLATWIECLDNLKKAENEGKDVISYPAKVNDYEKEVLLNNIIEFNKIFDVEDTDDFKGVSLCKDTAKEGGTINYDTLVSDCKGYLTKIMDGLLAENKDVETLAKTHKKLMRYIYYAIVVPTNVADDFNTLMPLGVTSDKQNEEVVYEYTPTDTLFNLTTDATYKDLIVKGRELSLSDNSRLIEGEPDEKEELLNIFLDNASEMKDGSVTYDDITNYWYLYFACGATYQPFSSAVGDEQFMNVLNSITGKADDTVDSFTNIYKEAILYKKPLYIMDLNSDSKVKGTAKQVTLAQLKEAVEDEEHKGLVIGKGVIDKVEDMNSYGYYTKQAESSTAKTSSSKSTENLKASDVSSPVLEISSDSMNVVTLQNIFARQGKLETKSLNPDREFLYLTVFGDIVLEDDTVVYPGCANSTLYGDGKAYYPYTLAFMQNYPNINVSSSEFGADKSEVKKRILTTEFSADEKKKNSEYPIDNLSEKLKGYVAFTNGSSSNSENRFLQWADIKGTSALERFNWEEIDNCAVDFTVYEFDEAEELFVAKNFSYNGNLFTNPLGWTAKAQTWASNSAVIVKDTRSSETDNYIGLFETDIKNEDIETKDLAQIARNFYTMTYTDDKGEEAQKTDKFNTKKIGKFVIGEVLNGLTNVQGYENYKDTEFEEYLSETSNIVKVKLTGLCKDFIEPLYNVTGVIGVENAYQSVILGNVMGYAMVFIVIVLLGILIALVYRFLTGIYDLLQVVVLGIISCAIGIIFVVGIPVYLPTIFNGILDIATVHESSDLGYMSLLMHMEDYDKTYNVKNSSPEISNTSSINLYKFKDDDFKDFCTEYKLDKSDLLTGGVAVIDSDAGLYVEGNILKCSLDSLFLNNPITGKYESTNVGKFYNLKSEKKVSSCIDYYTPYHLVVDSLVERLNVFSQVFRPRREFINYGGLTKDSFLMRDYIISPVFLDPTNLDLVGENYDMETQDAVESVIGKDGDIFNIKSIFMNASDETKQSLWYNTMEKNGALSETRFEKILAKTTLNTRKFLMDNYDKLQYISDENIIKMTALYITVSLTRQGGEINEEIYPMFINSEEFTLGDILLGAYVTDRDQFRFKNLEIVSYISESYGVLWCILFSVSVFVSWSILNITKFLIPVLYIALGLLLIIKYIFSIDRKYLVKGYIKGTLVIFIGYLIHCFTIILASKLKDSVFSILLPLIININILEMMLRYIITTILSDPGNLGGRNNIASIAPWIANKLGITTAMAAITGSFNRSRDLAQGAVEGVRDVYADYRDLNAYDNYYGQDSTIEDIMAEQQKHQSDREYHIDHVRSGNRKRVVKVTKLRDKDDFSDYRE